MEIKVSEEIKKACPQFAGIAIRATVKNTAYSESLWKKIDEFTVRYREMYTTDSIKDMVTIHATREAYKKCGKDPSRYRPSGEALCRRILRGIPLYQIDTLVDLINLVSIRHGYSIGGFDADKIQGDTLVLGIGKSGEPYEGIGRGELNIEGMVRYREMYTTDSIKDMVTIHATREAYKKCGKDPSRYRPSGEALCRRILRGISLYQIDTLVDLINLVSIRYGYSIGGFDADKIQGDTLVLGIGKSGEPYEGIGRGELNIEGMPVYRDAMGGIGTPTSDNERTKLEAGTTHLLTIINGYSGKEGLQEAADYMLELLKEFAASKDEELIYF